MPQILMHEHLTKIVSICATNPRALSRHQSKPLGSSTAKGYSLKPLGEEPLDGNDMLRLIEASNPAHTE